MAGKLRIPRMRGAVTGMPLGLLGATDALRPLIGPHSRFAYSPDRARTDTTGRLFLEILPGIAAFIAGVIVPATALRPVAVIGACFGGAWFAAGGAVAPLWTRGSAPAQVSRSAEPRLGRLNRSDPSPDLVSSWPSGPRWQSAH